MRWQLLLLTRPVMCAFAGVAVLLGAKLSKGQWIFDDQVMSAMLAMMCLTALAMVWDGLLDTFRGGPIKGAYHFVASHRTSVAVFAFGLLVVVSLSINSFSEIMFWDIPVAMISAVTLMVGACALVLGYPFVLGRAVGLPNLIVAGLSSQTITLGALVTGKVNSQIWLLSLAIFFILFAREILKDFEDVEIDKGFKATLPLWNRPCAWTFSAVFILAAAAMVYLFSRYLSGPWWPWSAWMVDVCFGATLAYIVVREATSGKIWLTIAMFLLVVGVALA